MGDLFADMPDVKSRAMFGGYGIYKDGIIFAIIAEGKLYFKVSDINRNDYEEKGSKPFEYVMPSGKKMQMGYWELPEEVMEDREILHVWVGRAVAVSKAAKKKNIDVL